MPPSSSSSSSFERYLKDFQKLSRQVEQSIHQQQQQERQQETQHNKPNNTLDLIYQCDDSLQMMTLEARSVGSSSMTNDNIISKTDMLDQIKACKFRLDILKEQCERQALFLGTSNSCGGNNSASTQRDKLRQQQDLIIKQNLQLDNAKQTIIETEEIATSINIELHNNRDILQRNTKRISDLSTMTTKASTLLKSMKSWF